MPRSRQNAHELTRRDVFRASGLAGVGLMVGGGAASAISGKGDRSLILLVLVGGPSQLDSFDPKPDAPSTVRGPFRSIATRVPGIRVCEHLPRLARRMDRVAIVRSLHHDTAPMHETGLQLLQTGRALPPGENYPHVGEVISPGGNGFVTLPDLQHAPRLDEAERLRYGRTDFGDSCASAFRLVATGTRVVVVNMYASVFARPSWDAHARGPFSTLSDYAESVLPTFDTAYNALLDDLERSGRLDTTLVVAAGEFGRTPHLNADGGRDHWTRCGSALLAGCGVRGGKTIGASDSIASEPHDRPVTPGDLVATMIHATGTDSRRLVMGDDARPVREAFA